MSYRARIVSRSVVLPSHNMQRLLGLGLGTLVAGSWLGIHIYAMFVFELSWSAWPQVALLAALQCWLSVGVFIVSHDAMHGSLAPGWQSLNSGLGAVLLFLYAGFAWGRSAMRISRITRTQAKKVILISIPRIRHNSGLGIGHSSNAISAGGR